MIESYTNFPRIRKGARCSGQLRSTDVSHSEALYFQVLNPQEEIHFLRWAGCFPAYLCRRRVWDVLSEVGSVTYGFSCPHGRRTPADEDNIMMRFARA